VWRATVLVFLPILSSGLASCRPKQVSVPNGGSGAGGGYAGSGSGGANTGGASTGSTTATGGGGAAGGTGGSGGTSDAGPPSDASINDANVVTNPLVVNHVMTCDTPPLAVPTQHIEAECAFGPTTGKCTGTTGGQQGTQTEDNGTDVGFIEGGDALWYAGIVMDGANTLTFHYAKGVDGGTIEIRLDSTTGTLLGTFTPASTGSWTTWQDGKVALSTATGSHTLYLVAAGTTAGILNLDWIELSASSASSTSAPLFHVNHLGFDTLGPKHAVVEGAANLGRYYIVDAKHAAVWCGSLTSVAFSAWGSSHSFYSIDFTELTQPGRYRLQVGNAVSDEFEIGDARLFAATFASVLGYFKASRADDPDVWAADTSVPLFGGSARADVRGGWYDASGDTSKYLSHLSYANFMNPQQIPLVAWALGWVYDQGGTALAAGGSAAAVQAEALWGTDYLLRVLDPAGYFYTNVFDGWSGNLGQRQICAIVGQYGAATADYQSALREGGGMSIAALARAARWKVDGSFTSAQYLAGAKLAFDTLNSNGGKYDDDGKENVIDDYTGLLAASELYATTQDAAYVQAARARATSLVGRLDVDGYFIADGATRPFWHASDAGLPIVALARYVQIETDAGKRDLAKKAMQKHLNYLLGVTGAVANPFGYARQHIAAGTASFFIPHDNESGYWWQGENARLASLAAAALLGAKVLGTSGTPYLDLLRFAGDQLDWILGANPYDICFLNGLGKNNPPAYCASKAQAGTLVGGIANGITGSNTDGSGIQWLSAPLAGGCGDDWRWVEQWLPHSAWFMVATTALAQ
jgi:Carbohydrate binding module (family 6)/Glycosyl hydrolase family 9/Cellulase N-terminal ig-like domain